MTDLPLPTPDGTEGMSLADLHRLRAALPGCELAMLTDLATGTVLGVSAALDHPQEHYDALCAEAALALAAAGPTAGALLVRPTGLRLVLRAPGYPDEGLCLVLPAAADAPAAVRDALAALRGVA